MEPMAALQTFRDRLATALWGIPALFAVGACVLAWTLLEVDQAIGSTGGPLLIIFGGTAEGARSVLSAIAQSMLTFTGLVFTVTMLVLQLVSAQLSPRVIPSFLRDRKNQVVLGLFVATFLYTLLVLRSVRSPAAGDGDAFVPGLSIWVALVLLIGSIAAFIYYIDHMAQSIRASSVIAVIADDAREAIERLFPERVGRGPAEAQSADPRDSLGPPGLVLKARDHGVLTAVDADALLRAASHGDRLVALLPAIGDYVPLDAPLLHLWGRWDRQATDRLREAIGLSHERTITQDAAFGLRQLVDVATRAASPASSDATTAVQAIHRIHDLLRRLAGRELPSRVRLDDGGVPRLILPRPGWEDYIHLAVDEIRTTSSRHLAVARRLREMLVDLQSVAGPDRMPVLRIELAALDRAIARNFDDPVDLAFARAGGTGPT